MLFAATWNSREHRSQPDDGERCSPPLSFPGLKAGEG
jgi:hypothetical protein